MYAARLAEPDGFLRSFRQRQPASTPRRRWPLRAEAEDCIFSFAERYTPPPAGIAIVIRRQSAEMALRVF